MPKTDEVDGAPLDYWVCRALGVPVRELELRPVQRTTDTICVRTIPVTYSDRPMLMTMDYSTNWAFTGPLIERFGMYVEWDAEGYYVASTRTSGLYRHKTALGAICRAVVAHHFGETLGILAT